MAKYIVKLTKFKHRCSITIPKDLVDKRDLRKFDYLLLKATNKKPITIRGFDVKDTE